MMKLLAVLVAAALNRLLILYGEDDNSRIGRVGIIRGGFIVGFF